MGIRHSSDANDGDPAIRWSRRYDGGKRFDAIDAEPTDAPGSGATGFEEALALEVLRAFPGISPADLGVRVRSFVEEVRKVTAEETTPPRAADLAFGDGRESVWREIDALLGDERSAPPYSIPDRIRMLVADVKRLRAEIEKITRGQPEERSQLLARSRIYEQWAPTMRELLGLFGYCTPSELPGLAEKLIRENNNARAEIEKLKSEAKDNEEALDHYRARTYRDGETDQLQRDLDAARAALAMKERERDAARRERDAARAEIARLEARDREGRWIAEHARVLAETSEYARRITAYLSGEPPAPDPLLVEARALLSDEFDKSVSEYRSRRISLLTKLDARIGGR